MPSYIQELMDVVFTWLNDHVKKQNNQMRCEVYPEADQELPMHPEM